MGMKSDSEFYKVQLVTTPAAGSEFSLTARGRGVWRVLSLAFTFTASAAVANRRVQLRADDGTTVWFAAPASLDIVAAGSAVFSAYGGAAGVGLTGASATIALPADGLLLLPGHRLRSATLNIDVGDTYTNIAALVEEFPTGPDFERLPTVDSLVQARS